MSLREESKVSHTISTVKHSTFWVVLSFWDLCSIDDVVTMSYVLYLGRVGSGDTGWFHNFFYDDTGSFAFHTAVHDGFGYIKFCHDVGPGYDYLESSMFTDINPLAGQIGGLTFWNSTLDEMETVGGKYIRI